MCRYACDHVMCEPTIFVGRSWFVNYRYLNGCSLTKNKYGFETVRCRFNFHCPLSKVKVKHKIKRVKNLRRYI